MQYIIMKEFPNSPPVGTIGKTNERWFLEFDYERFGKQKFANYHPAAIQEFPEYFEKVDEGEIEETKKKFRDNVYRPGTLDPYWSITEKQVNRNVWEWDHLDYMRLESGNVFRTPEHAKECQDEYRRTFYPFLNTRPNRFQRHIPV
jgi:hypothetical protein